MFIKFKFIIKRKDKIYMIYNDQYLADEGGGATELRDGTSNVSGGTTGGFKESLRLSQ